MQDISLYFHSPMARENMTTYSVSHHVTLFLFFPFSSPFPIFFSMDAHQIWVI